MEALSRLFQNKSFSFNCHGKGQKNDHKSGDRGSFGPDNVRLVVFRDHDLKGRSLIFDSKVIHRIGDAQGSCRRKSKDSGTTAASTGQPPPDGAKHTPMRQLSDTNMFGEMMFGSVAMAYKGSTLKIHTIRSPPQVIITKIFAPVKSNKDVSGTGDNEFDNGSYQSNSSIYTYESSTPRDFGSGGSSGPHSAPVISQSVPVAVPCSPPTKSLDEPAADTGDSGIAGSMTSSYSSHTTPYPSPGSSASTGSNSYIHRRLTRSKNTSLELHIRTKLSDDAIEKPLPASKRPPQYGIGIVFNMPEGQDIKNRHFQNFLFSHIMLIEGHVNKLRCSLEKALKTKGFHISTLEGLDVFRQAVFELYFAQRLDEPVWLSMMSADIHKVTRCKTFLKEFMIAVDKHNTKGTKMFLSTLITAVLRHHLAWVPTVAPAGGTPSRTYLDKHSAKWLDALAKSHPYNPLWAQLGDLYGAIGYPLRLSRTMVIGKKQDIIKRFLYILSYFIRCSEVYETVDSVKDIQLDTLDEKQRCSSEISIPQCISDSKDGSLKSPGHQHASFTSCSQCGSVVEFSHTRGNHVNIGSTQSPNGSQRPRINSVHRIKSPSPVLESNEINFEFDQTKIHAFLKYKNRTANALVTKASYTPSNADNFTSMDMSKSHAKNQESDFPNTCSDISIVGDLNTSSNIVHSNFTNVVHGLTADNKLNDLKCDLHNNDLTTNGKLSDLKCDLRNNDRKLSDLDPNRSDIENSTSEIINAQRNPSRFLESEVLDDSSADHLAVKRMLFFRQFEETDQILDMNSENTVTDIKDSVKIQGNTAKYCVGANQTPSIGEVGNRVQTNQTPSTGEVDNCDRSVYKLSDSMNEQTESTDKAQCDNTSLLSNSCLNSCHDDSAFIDSPAVIPEDNSVQPPDDSSIQSKTIATSPTVRIQSDSCVPSSTLSGHNLYPNLDIIRIHSDSEVTIANKTTELDTCVRPSGGSTSSGTTLYPDLKLLKKQEGLSTPEDAPKELFPPVGTDHLSKQSTDNNSSKVKDIKSERTETNNSANCGRAKLDNVEHGDVCIPYMETNSEANKTTNNTTKLHHIALGDIMVQPTETDDCYYNKGNICRLDSLSEGRKCQLSPIAEPIEEVKVERIRNVSREIVQDFGNSPISDGSSLKQSPKKGGHRDSGFDSDDMIPSHNLSLKEDDCLRITNDINQRKSNVKRRLEEKSDRLNSGRFASSQRSSHQVDSGIFDSSNSSEGFTNICIKQVKSAKDSKKSPKKSSSACPVYNRSISTESQSSIMENYGNVACPDMQELDKLTQICTEESSTCRTTKTSNKHKLKRLVSGASDYNEYFQEEVEDVVDDAEKSGSILLYDLINTESITTRGKTMDKDNGLLSSSSTNGSIVGFPVNSSNECSLNAVINTGNLDYASDPASSNSIESNSIHLLPQEIDKSILLDKIAAHPAVECDISEQLTMSSSSHGSEELDGSLSRDHKSRFQSISDDYGFCSNKTRKPFDELCSTSMTGSDMTDIEGSLCSECTLRTERSNSVSMVKHRRAAYRRTTSVPSAGTPGRCRSVTPTELNRRRHASALSINTIEPMDAMDTVSIQTAHSLEHINMPNSVPRDNKENVVPLERNIGHSLLAGYSPHYLSDFALHGTSDTSFYNRLHQDLMMSVQKPVLDEHIAETACVVADTDKWSVKVLSCHYNASDRVQTQEVCASKLVSDIIDSVYNLWKLKMSPEFCLMHLEDRLQEVYFKSKMLAEYVKINRKVDLKELAAMLGFDNSDLPLLLAVAGTHTPAFILGLIP